MRLPRSLRFLTTAVVVLWIASCSSKSVNNPDPGAGGDAGTDAPETGGSAGSTPDASKDSSGDSDAPECKSAAECGEPTECREPICIAGACGTKLAKSPGTPLEQQTAGDCVTQVCDSSGEVIATPDQDPPIDHLECTQDLCAGTNPVNPPEPAGTACGAAGSLGCDGAGNCAGCTFALECGAPPPCSTWTCTNGTCVPTPVSDGADCGLCQVCTGGACAPASNGTPDPECSPGDTCNDQGICKCDDLVMDGSETDVDCGGGACAGCDLGKQCGIDTDCDSGHCADGRCCNENCQGTCEACTAAGTCGPIAQGQDPIEECDATDVCNGVGQCECSDGVLTSGEDATDCGGPNCATCPGKISCSAGCGDDPGDHAGTLCCDNAACNNCPNQVPYCQTLIDDWCSNPGPAVLSAHNLGPGKGEPVNLLVCLSGWRCTVSKCRCKAIP